MEAPLDVWDPNGDVKVSPMKGVMVNTEANE